MTLQTASTTGEINFRLIITMHSLIRVTNQAGSQYTRYLFKVKQHTMQYWINIHALFHIIHVALVSVTRDCTQSVSRTDSNVTGISSNTVFNSHNSHSTQHIDHICYKLCNVSTIFLFTHLCLTKSSVYIVTTVTSVTKCMPVCKGYNRR